MQVGWLGVGAIGAPMATRAARSGHSVRAYDITPERSAALAADGVQPAETIAAATASADFVAIMVAIPGQLEQVLFGLDGAASALPDGVVVIMSTAGRTLQWRMAAHSPLAPSCGARATAPTTPGSAFPAWSATAQ
jgi:3-hydroxyisobutyrate dehydrogenase